jgi:hypothetical protein
VNVAKVNIPKITPFTRLAWSISKWGFAPLRLVEAAAGRMKGRANEPPRIPALCGKCQIAQGRDEKIERGFRFLFGRLDQHRAMRHEREINRHRVKAFVDHRLGEIER